MSLIPEWAPNIHPLIVHFPIALLFTAILFDLLGLIFRNINWLRYAAGSLYILGAAAAIVTYLTGKDAADSVNVPAIANPTLSEHANWALITVWYFGIYALLRLAFLWKKLSQNRLASFLVFLIGAGGLFVVYETGEHGAELVFRHGVGVQATEKGREPEPAKKEPEKARPDTGIIEHETHSWEWHPGDGAAEVLRNEFRWLRGSAEHLSPGTARDSLHETVLVLKAEGRPCLFTAGEALRGMQSDLRIHLGQFTGEVMLVHHIQDSLNYDVVGISRGQFLIGRVQNGEMKFSEKAPALAEGWFTLRGVAEGGHFRGYVNDKLVVHGHAEDLPPGPVGLFVNGNGTILLDEIKVTALK